MTGKNLQCKLSRASVSIPYTGGNVKSEMYRRKLSFENVDDARSTLTIIKLYARRISSPAFGDNTIRHERNFLLN